MFTKYVQPVTFLVCTLYVFCHHLYLRATLLQYHLYLLFLLYMVCTQRHLHLFILCLAKHSPVFSCVIVWESIHKDNWRPLQKTSCFVVYVRWIRQQRQWRQLWNRTRAHTVHDNKDFTELHLLVTIVTGIFIIFYVYDFVMNRYPCYYH